MKELKIKELRIRNFKGIIESNIFFNERETRITGKNETGKTSTMDAFFWLFDGKDSYNRQDFGIKMLDENNDEIHNLIISVEGVFDWNGKEVILRKVQSEVWVTHTKDIEKTLKGNTTAYYINFNEVKKKEYDAFIEEIGSGEMLRILMSSLYFNEVLDWKKRRKIIADKFIKKTFIDYIDQEKFSELKKLDIKDYNSALLNLNKRIKSFDSQIESIPIRIDEILLDIKDLSFEGNIKDLMARRETVQKDMQKLYLEERSFVDNAYIENVKNIDKRISNILDEKNAELKKIFELTENNRLKKDLEAQLEQLIDNVTSINLSIRANQKEIEMIETKVDQQREDYINQKNLKFNDQDAICQMCGQVLPVYQKKDLKLKFEKRKAEKLEAITGVAKELKAKYRNLKVNLKAYNDKLIKTNKKIESLKKEIDQIQEVNIKPSRDFDAEIKELESRRKSFSPRQLDNSGKIRVLQDELDSISKKISNFEHIQKQQERILELREQHKNLASEQMEFKKLRQLLENANREYLTSIEGNINKKLGKNIKIELFKVLINGTIKEVCNILIRTKAGSFVPYQYANTGNKINAGIAFVGLLSESEDTYYPLWVDNVESVSQLLTVESQIIIKKKKKSVKKLTVN